MRSYRNNIWVWAIGISLIAHLILAFAISTTTVTRVESRSVGSESRPRQAQADRIQTNLDSKAGIQPPIEMPTARATMKPRSADQLAKADPPAPTDVKSVQKLIADQRQSIAQMSDKQRLETLHDKSGSVAKMDSGDVSLMTSSLEAAEGVDRERAVEPRAGVKGDFDGESALLCDIQRVSPQPKTGPEYRWIMVDKDGRSMSYDVPARDMTPENMNAFNIFESTRDSPNLRALLGTALRIADKKMNEKN